MEEEYEYLFDLQETRVVSFGVKAATYEEACKKARAFADGEEFDDLKWSDMEYEDESYVLRSEDGYVANAYYG